ncbi:MAG: 4-hydroxy-2-oxoheptanedioate aldolase [Gaiellales bacterium]|nr:4-hydroxy-2-oxoheptanedioate aldolase [Gaiellales bacterium]
MSYEIAGSASATAGLSLRQIVQERRVAYGGWCMVPSAFATEVVSASGCDWLCIDLQHGLIGDDAMRTMVQAAAIRATPVAVRVPWNEPASIMRALDAGADGVIVPMVNTAAEAAQAVAATRYPPLGYRSWGPVRSIMAEPAFDPARGNERSVCIVMVETVEAFGNLEAILEVPGVDSVLVGPSDLAISHSGDTSGAGSSERDVAMIREIAAACARRGLAAAISCGSGEEVRRWQAAGYTLLALPSDAALLGAGMASVLAAVREGSAPT